MKGQKRKRAGNSRPGKGPLNRKRLLQLICSSLFIRLFSPGFRVVGRQGTVKDGPDRNRAAGSAGGHDAIENFNRMSSDRPAFFQMLSSAAIWNFSPAWDPARITLSSSVRPYFRSRPRMPTYLGKKLKFRIIVPLFLAGSDFPYVVLCRRWAPAEQNSRGKRENYHGCSSVPVKSVPHQ